jgi:hypothetical protein
MSVVRAAAAFPGTVHEAESCWCDASRWPSWVDGLDHVLETDADWPAPGTSVAWQSGPAGRGRVCERVVSFDPLSALTVAVDDDSISGRQTVTFVPAGQRVEVELALDYRITKRSMFTPLVDLLFIRRAMEASLAATLARFGAELAMRRTSADHY